MIEMEKKNSIVSLGRFSSEKFSVALTDYNFGLKQNWHKHEDFIFAMNIKGHLREQVRSEDRLIKPLSIGIKAPEVKHTDYFNETGVRAIKISLTPKFFSELEAKCLINATWSWAENSPAKRPFLRIIDNLLHDNSAQNISENIYETIAAVYSENDFNRRSEPPSWLKNAQENLHDTFAEGIRLTKLAEEAGVHPVYFARQFRKFFGCSVGRYIRQLQFQAATELLTQADKNLAEIAYQVGFSDQSHLSRIFLNEFGITPGHFRKIIN